MPSRDSVLFLGYRLSVIRLALPYIHDLSQVDTHGQLPRFNMPLELCLFLGAQKFGEKKSRRKACLVLEDERYQYQRFISDLAGVDPAANLKPARGSSRSRSQVSVRLSFRSRRARAELYTGALS